MKEESQQLYSVTLAVKNQLGWLHSSFHLWNKGILPDSDVSGKDGPHTDQLDNWSRVDQEARMRGPPEWTQETESFCPDGELHVEKIYVTTLKSKVLDS